jgi:hypothetical protein
MTDRSLPGMRIVRVVGEPVLDFVEERITGILLPVNVFTSASVGFVAPGVAQRHHKQHRPQDGVEIIFVYAGRFRVVGEDGVSSVYDADEDGPVYVEVESEAPASLENTGSTNVKFFSVFAPPFAVGEHEYLEPQ